MPEAPTIPSGWQIERTLAVWYRIKERLDADPELELDEERIATEFREEGVQHPDQLLSRLIDAVRWCNLREAEADDLRREMVARRERYAARDEWLRSMIRDLLDILDRTSHRGRIAKAIIGASKQHVVIKDIDALPEEYVKRTVTPNRELIAEHMREGVIIPGAELSNPAPTLVIRKA